eukprot:2417988-Pleurochrysis_carterae.AAC.1
MHRNNLKSELKLSRVFKRAWQKGGQLTDYPPLQRKTNPIYRVLRVRLKSGSWRCSNLPAFPMVLSWLTTSHHQLLVRDIFPVDFRIDVLILRLSRFGGVTRLRPAQQRR